MTPVGATPDRERIVARWEGILMDPTSHTTAKRMAREALANLHRAVPNREPGQDDEERNETSITDSTENTRSPARAAQRQTPDRGEGVADAGSLCPEPGMRPAETAGLKRAVEDDQDARW